MQFQGSRHFPGQTIDNFLSSIGLSIGSDANAVTSFDDTQYSLRVPTDRPGILDRSLTVLEDWAGGATFDEPAIERQRAIVLAEWRRNLGADERTADKMRHVQLEGSRYADRPPVGDPAVIQNAKREQLVRFYRDWYRPDLMAVIVVGDVDKNAVAAMIRQHFSAIESPASERQRPIYDVQERAGTRYAVLTDKENTSTAVSLSDLRPARDQGSIGGYRDILKDQLFSQMLGDRLDELAQGERPPFLRAAAGRGLFPAPKTRDEASLQALVPNDGVTRGLDALVSELKRVTTFGFTTTELERAKQANMVEYSTALEGTAVLAGLARRARDGALADDDDYAALGDAARMQRNEARYLREFDSLRRRGIEPADEAALAVLERMSSGERLWYRVGARMAERIEREQGRPALIALITEKPGTLVSTYRNIVRR